MRSALGAMRRRFISSAFQRQALLGKRGPIVSFTFDDFPRTALRVGGEILKAHGFRGTYYTALGLMGTRNHLGDQFQREDLDVLLREGHDLAAHTYSHLSCRSVSASRFREDLRRGQQAVCQLGGQKGSGNFAFPFGEVTANAKRFVGPDVASARGIWGGLNGPIIDLNLLKANSLYGDESKRNGVQDLILENQRCGSWLIFYTHDVQSTPSRFGCTPELLEFAVSVASGSGARILTIAEVVNELVAERHEEPFGSRS